MCVYIYIYIYIEIVILFGIVFSEPWLRDYHLGFGKTSEIGR